jgi:DNA modification methylase
LLLPNAVAPAAYAIEIDPIYLEVALRRWERFSGQQAERIDG